MKKLFLLLVIFGIYSSYSFAQDDEMKKWMEYMTPGKEHKQMASQNGEWIVNTKMWMSPTDEPTISDGTATSEMLLDGRYQKFTNKGVIMGMPFEGISITGFDNAKKMYINTWIDNMGTGMMISEGTYDEATKTINMKGKYFDPMTMKDTDFRETLKLIDDKSMYMEMFYMKDGKEFKSMEIKYTKK